MAIALDQNALTDAETLQANGGDLAALSADMATRAVNEASAAVLAYLNRPVLFEAGRTDVVPGFGRFDLRVPLRPIWGIDSGGYTRGDGTVDAFSTPVDFVVRPGGAGLLYRPAGWIWTAQRRGGLVQDCFPGTEEPRYSITYSGGWITGPQAVALPAAWPGAAAVVPVGALLTPAAQQGQVWRAQQSALLVACQTGGVEPNWPAAPKIGAKQTDGAMVWIYLGTKGAAGSRGSAASLPWDIERATLITATSFSRQNLDDADVTSETVIGGSQTFQRSGIPASARAMLDKYRVLR